MAEYEVFIMIVKFDSLNRFEVPKMYICNPGSVYNANGTVSNMIGILKDTSDEEIVFNFNATSELNFRAYKVKYDTPEETEDSLKKYRSLQNRRVIFVENIGFFVITQAVDGYSDGQDYKDITASSCEVEIENKNIPYIENNTYKFIDLLETLVSTLPRWTIGTVHDDIKEKYRTFEDVAEDKNILSFFMEDMQEAYECIFIFDIVNRIINVYDQNDYVRQTPIHLTKDDLIKTIEITENSEDLYTALNVTGDENLSIAAINPLGINTIYNFDYYLSWMSDELRDRVESWTELIKSQFDDYYNYNLDYYSKLTEQYNLQYEIDRLDTQIAMYQRCRENIVAEASIDNVDDYNTILIEYGGTEIEILEEIEDTLNNVDELIAEAASLRNHKQSQYDSLTIEMEDIQNNIRVVRESVNLKTYFTTVTTDDNGDIVGTSTELYDELYNFIYEGTYQDEYITVTDDMTYVNKFEQMKTLYDRATTQLEKISSPTQEFSIDVENFVFSTEFQEWSSHFETGCLINIELEENDVAALFLSSIQINYHDHDLNLTFGNRFNKYDPKSLFKNALGDIKKSSNSINYIKNAIYPITSGRFNEMEEMINGSRTLTKNAALTSTNEEVVIDATGYTGRKLLENGTYDPRQVKIIGKSIVFTDDAWDTCKTALGELILGDGETTYGINAATLIGDLIMGNKLKIYDDGGNELFTIVDNKIAAQIADVNGNIAQLQMTADGLELSVKELGNKKINSVTTSTGYTFDADGLKIHKSGEEITNKLDNTGMYVTKVAGDDTEEILTANNEGVIAVNLTAKKYLIIGNNSRFEDYKTDNDECRTACFFIGETLNNSEPE